jgi:hypothetical protein
MSTTIVGSRESYTSEGRLDNMLLQLTHPPAAVVIVVDANFNLERIFLFIDIGNHLDKTVVVGTLVFGPPILVIHSTETSPLCYK